MSKMCLNKNKKTNLFKYLRALELGRTVILREIRSREITFNGNKKLQEYVKSAKFKV